MNEKILHYLSDPPNPQPPASSNKSVELIFLAVNLFCFVIYTSLAIKLYRKLNGVKIEKRTHNVIRVFASTFLCKLDILSFQGYSEINNLDDQRGHHH